MTIAPYAVADDAATADQAASCAPEQAPNPCEYTQTVIKSITDKLDANAEQIKTDKNASTQMVNDIIKQFVDIKGMSIFAVGKPTWDAADEATQKAFEENFQDLIDSLYSSAFQQYDGQKVDVAVQACNGDNYKTAKIFQVPTTIEQSSNTPAIKVNYKMVKVSCDSWKFYDFNVDNVSALLSFRSQFMSLMQSNKPKEGQSKLAMLNDLLSSHNDKNDVGGSKAAAAPAATDEQAVAPADNTSDDYNGNS